MQRDILVFDAGHTRTKFAVCRIALKSPLPAVLSQQAVRNEESLDWTLVERCIAEHSIQKVVMTGTHRERAQRLMDEWPVTLPAPVMLDRTQLPLQINVDLPEKVGIDRLLNAVAANAIRQSRQPVISVDSGTAITVDLIDAEGTFLGGAILPGILMGAKSLHEETTTLPHVDVWELLKTEPEVLGRNTEAAIASGLYWGHLGSVREIVNRLRDQLESVPQAENAISPLVLLTGGAAGILSPYLSGSRWEPDLALQGLALAASNMPGTNEHSDRI